MSKGNTISKRQLQKIEDDVVNFMLTNDVGWFMTEIIGHFSKQYTKKQISTTIHSLVEKKIMSLNDWHSVKDKLYCLHSDILDNPKPLERYLYLKQVHSLN